MKIVEGCQNTLYLIINLFGIYNTCTQKNKYICLYFQNIISIVHSSLTLFNLIKTILRQMLTN